MVESKQQSFQNYNTLSVYKGTCLLDWPKQPALGKHTVFLALSCIRTLQGKTPCELFGSSPAAPPFALTLDSENFFGITKPE